MKRIALTLIAVAIAAAVYWKTRSAPASDPADLSAVQAA